MNTVSKKNLLIGAPTTQDLQVNNRKIGDINLNSEISNELNVPAANQSVQEANFRVNWRDLALQNIDVQGKKMNQRNVQVNQSPDLVANNARFNIQYDNIEDIVAPGVSIRREEV